MPDVLQGVLGVEDVLAGKKYRDVTPGIQKKYKTIDPMYRIFNKMPKGRVATNEKVEWTLKEEIPSWAYLTTTVGESATAGAAVELIPAETEGGSADATYFKVGDIIEVPSRADNGTTTTNIGRVATWNTGVSIEIDPIGWASNVYAASAANDLKFVATTTNDMIHVISDSSEEYSQKPTMKVVKDTQEFNYIQFLRVPYIIGNIQKDGKNYTGPERAERKDETYRHARLQAEETFMHGKRFYVDGTNGRQFFMGGLKRYITDGAGTNILNNWSAGLTEAQWDEFLVKGPGYYGSNRRLCFFAADLFLKINSFAKTKERIQGTVNMYGLEFTKYLSPDNKIYYMHMHHLLKNDYAGAGMIIDPEYLKIRPYGTQGTMSLQTDIQENDRAGTADEWQIIMSLEVSRIEPHAWITM